MKKNPVLTAQDDIARFATCTASEAIEEFIWNALDAGSNRVEVRLEKNKVGPLVDLKSIEIEDDGEGMPFEQVQVDFGSTGGSRKVRKKVNKEGRVLHGRFGRGRFRFLVLGGKANWRTNYEKDGKLYSYEVRIRADSLDYYENSNPQQIDNGHSGTVVRIESIKDEARSLLNDSMLQFLRQQLAFYLTSYPGIAVCFEGESLDVNEAIEHRKEYSLNVSDVTDAPVTLVVVEWSKATKAESEQLLLCDECGFVLSDIPVDIPVKDINCTAYVSSKQIRNWHESGELAAGEMLPGIGTIAKVARKKLAAHIRRRLAQKTKSLVKQWKAERVYPYRSTATQPSEKAEQQVFNILAAQIHMYHRPFRSATKESKRLTLELVKQALESDPTTLRRLLAEVLKLPEDRQRELAQLLEHTNLEEIIEASKIVHQRLDTIQGFERLLFAKEWRSKLRERTQLHRLLVHELWIFGEEYQLDTDDETLREVLKAHVKYLGRDELAPEIDASSIRGIDEIPDLMLTRRFRRGGDLFQHLVVELKNPRVKAGEDEITQVERVARNVKNAEQFSKNAEKVKWTFMLLVNDLGEYGRYRLESSTFPGGCIAKDNTHEVLVLEWGDVLHDAKLRYEFFRERLNLEASGERGLEYLETNYSHLLSGKGMTKKREIESGKLEPKKKTG